MSKLFIGILSAAQLAAIHSAGQVAEQMVLSEGQKLVATLKTTSIGSVVTADIAALKDSSISGAEKFAKVLANTTPLVLSYVTGGGLSALAGDAEGIARELVQSLYNDTIGVVTSMAAAVKPVAETAQAIPGVLKDAA